MRQGWLLLVVALIPLGCLCSWCLWFGHERPRFSQEFDIGGGRTLRVWSIRDEKLFGHAFRDLDQNVREQVARVREHPFLPPAIEVRGFVYDVKHGSLREVESN